MALTGCLLSFPGSAAQAADESATAGISMTPSRGTLYKEALRPVDWRVEVEVSAPYSSPRVQPTKRVKAFFPREMKFIPGPNTAVCPESEVGPPPVNLSVPPEQVISRCPDALIGNGSSVIRLAQANCQGCVYLEDPVLLIFNGGLNAKGQAKLSIYGYSEFAATGLYMEGVLRNGVLDVAIPPITGDSSTSTFDLNIPGADSPFPERRGVDPDYVQTTCATGSWKGYAEFALGSRDTLGQATSPEVLIRSPEFETSCIGAEGKAALGRLTVKGPSGVRKGIRNYGVVVRNTGTATARAGRLKVTGPGTSGGAVIGNLKPGARKTVMIKIRHRRSGKLKLRFQARFNDLRPRSGYKGIKVT